MPKLRNPKYEAFAHYRAAGDKQVEAYEKAGYRPDKGAASRMANDPRIKKRVEEIKLSQFIDSGAVEEDDEEKTTAIIAETDLSEEEQELLKKGHSPLVSMGISSWWIADKFRKIYISAMEKKNFTAATKAVENLQKMVEQENEANKQGNDAVAADKDDRVSITAVTNLLREFKEITAGQKDKDPAEEAQDITPKKHSLPSFEELKEHDDRE